MHGYVAVVAGALSALVVVTFALFTPVPTNSVVGGTALVCGVPALAFGLTGRFVWRKRPRSLAVGLWIGGIGAAAVMVLPVSFGLTMANTSF